MCLGGDDGGSAELGAQQLALSKKLAQSQAAPPMRADEERRQTVVGAIRQVQNMRGASATYLTSGGAAGDPQY